MLRTLLSRALVVVISLAAVGCSSDSSGPDSSGSARQKPVACSGKCDGPNDVWVSPYQARLDKMNEIWPGTPPITKVEDAYTVLVDLGTEKFPAPTHLFGVPVQVIPYSNEDNTFDAAGNPVARGDSVIAEVYPRGVVGYAIKHHRPAHRKLTPQDLQADMKEQVKLQDTHIEIVVGVDRDGQPGAITLNNPQNYEQGLFGTPDYSMIFVKPVWPDYLGSTEVKAFNDNVRTMIAAFNAVSDFPGAYNGGDPLAANNLDKLREHVKQMVLAIGGDTNAQAFFKDPQNLIYCAELAFVGTSAGLQFPLNDATMVPLVGQTAWDLFKAEVDKHNAGQTSAFESMNANARVKYVDLTLAPADLRAVPEYAPNPESERPKLAFQPMTMADILQQFLRTHVPREQLGEQLAPVQGALLEQMKPGVLEAMAMDQLPATDPRRAAVEQLFDQLVSVVKTPYPSYADFQGALEPLMVQARQMTGPRDDTGAGLFVPPSLLHVVAQGKNPGGLIGLRYVGHGIHWSAVEKPAAPPPPDPGDQGQLDSLPADTPYSKSCRASCGGSSPDGSCWCDDLCSGYGDCCSDRAQVCQ